MIKHRTIGVSQLNSFDMALSKILEEERKQGFEYKDIKFQVVVDTVLSGGIAYSALVILENKLK